MERVYDSVSISTTFYKQHLCMKVLPAAFMCLQLRFVIFCQKEIGAKSTYKMLVKLTNRGRRRCYHSVSFS